MHCAINNGGVLLENFHDRVSNLVKNSKPINHNVKSNNKAYDSDSIIYSRQNVGKNVGRVFGLPIISDLIKTKDTSSFVPNSKPRLVSLFQVGMGTTPQFINVVPDISSNEFVVTNQFCKSQLNCNNRKNVFNSGFSKTFKPSTQQKNGPIKYLDGSSVSGSSGNDYITFSQSKSKFQADIFLAKKIDGLFQTQATVEGIMGLSRESQLWKKLDESNLDQVIGFALPLDNCNVGSISLGGIDNRFIKGPLHSISRLQASEPFHSIKINAAYVGDIPVDVTAIDSILDTRSNRISFGKASSDFFNLINATKSPEGWKVPNPVNISFDITLNNNQIVKFELPSNAICDRSIGSGKDCIVVLDDGSGPLNTWIFGTPFLQNFYFAIDLKQNLIKFADRNNFCPPTTTATTQSSTKTFTKQPKQTGKEEKEDKGGDGGGAPLFTQPPEAQFTQPPQLFQPPKPSQPAQSTAESIQPSQTFLDVPTTQQFTTQFTLQLFTTQSITTQLSTVQSNTTQLYTTQFNTTQFSTVQSNSTQLSTIQSNTTQLSTIQSNTTQLFTTQFNTTQSTIQPAPISSTSTIIPTITNFIYPETVVIDLRQFPMELVYIDIDLRKFPMEFVSRNF
ncbi:13267_t:CDS:2 [Cetraspora pellucida]|uniref:13267_t:CDS:1 n=1 Tax=Cetraspora pellucida TaxID=1433469 RepID=A0ACA9KBA3_9GLOM|nr:13267_t:CDS:2 [Cetraspora pellucida]